MTVMPMTDTTGEREQADFTAETHGKLVAVGVGRPAEVVVLIARQPALVELGVVGSFDAHWRVGVVWRTPTFRR
jgi:hypothetical protein